MTWLRMKFYPATQIIGSVLVRYYVDAVRSDGNLIRAGIDVDPGAETSQTQTQLRANLDSFLGKDLKVAFVGVDGFKGVDGWVEQ